MDISVAKAQNKLCQLLQAAEQEPIVIRRRGKPVGVIITPEEYAEMRRLRAYLEMLPLAEELRDSGTTAKDLLQLSRAELEAKA